MCCAASPRNCSKRSMTSPRASPYCWMWSVYFILAQIPVSVVLSSYPSIFGSSCSNAFWIRWNKWAIAVQ